MYFTKVTIHQELNSFFVFQCYSPLKPHLFKSDTKPAKQWIDKANQTEDR